jgi:hypothetical protein
VTPYLKKKKNPSQKRDGGVAQSVGPQFKLQYLKKNKQTATTKKCGQQKPEGCLLLA